MSRLSLRFAPAVLGLLAMAGFTIGVYLTAAHWGNQPIACGGLCECDFVNASEYASVAGIPVSLLGVFVYAGLAATSVMWLLTRGSEPWPAMNWGLWLAGAGYAGYLTYVELAVLHAICVWCVGSAAILVTGMLLSTAAMLAWEPDQPLGTEPAGRSSNRRRSRRGAETR